MKSVYFFTRVRKMISSSQDKEVIIIIFEFLNFVYVLIALYSLGTKGITYGYLLPVLCDFTVIQVYSPQTFTFNASSTVIFATTPGLWNFPSIMTAKIYCINII